MWTRQQLQYEVEELQPAMIRACLKGQTFKTGVDSGTDRCSYLSSLSRGHITVAFQTSAENPKLNTYLNVMKVI